MMLIMVPKIRPPCWRVCLRSAPLMGCDAPCFGMCGEYSTEVFGQSRTVTDPSRNRQALRGQRWLATCATLAELNRQWIEMTA